MRAAWASLLACVSASVLVLNPVPAAAQAVRTLDIAGGVLPAGQRLIQATQGDVLRWRIASDRAGELHLHAYRISATIQPGQPRELTFKVHAAGRFRVEWHAADAVGAASSGGGGHHAPPLAVLEVRPR